MRLRVALLTASLLSVRGACGTVSTAIDKSMAAPVWQVLTVSTPGPSGRCDSRFGRDGTRVAGAGTAAVVQLEVSSLAVQPWASQALFRGFRKAFIPCSRGNLYAIGLKTGKMCGFSAIIG